MNPFWKGEKKCRPVLEEDWTDPDRIFQTFANAYHGLPNAARARNMEDDRQWYVKDANAPHDPPRFHQGYPWESSTNGIAEFRGTEQIGTALSSACNLYRQLLCRRDAW